jgi:uncharacterized protein YciI
MRIALLALCLGLFCPNTVFGAAVHSASPEYDAALAERLGADQYGMKRYVLVLLTTGPRTVAADETERLFAGHMANINRLADEGKLVVAGPMGKNDHHYEGIFILNVANVEEARALLATDPAVTAGLLAFEAFRWYGSAALQEVTAIHSRIDKSGLTHARH